MEHIILLAKMPENLTLQLPILVVYGSNLIPLGANDIYLEATYILFGSIVDRNSSFNH